MSKTPEEHFRDWESHAFGYGYGTGEPYTIKALRLFLGLCQSRDDESPIYDHAVLEECLTPTVAWLLINSLCRLDIIEYGTSPRFGWLTAKGKRLKAFMLSKTPVQLIEICCDHDEDYAHCTPDYCNCGYPHENFDENRVCDNPFWTAGSHPNA